jgi:hypothetical protein
MAAISAAVIKLHEVRMPDRLEWLRHLLRRCEAKAAKIAEQATHGPHACGDATFIEVCAKSLPALLS